MPGGFERTVNRRAFVGQGVSALLGLWLVGCSGEENLQIPTKAASKNDGLLQPVLNEDRVGEGIVNKPRIALPEGESLACAFPKGIGGGFEINCGLIDREDMESLLGLINENIEEGSLPPVEKLRTERIFATSFGFDPEKGKLRKIAALVLDDEGNLYLVNQERVVRIAQEVIFCQNCSALETGEDQDFHGAVVELTEECDDTSVVCKTITPEGVKYYLLVNTSSDLSFDGQMGDLRIPAVPWHSEEGRVLDAFPLLDQTEMLVYFYRLDQLSDGSQLPLAVWDPLSGEWLKGNDEVVSKLIPTVTPTIMPTPTMITTPTSVPVVEKLPTPLPEPKESPFSAERILEGVPHQPQKRSLSCEFAACGMGCHLFALPPERYLCWEDSLVDILFEMNLFGCNPNEAYVGNISGIIDDFGQQNEGCQANHSQGHGIHAAPMVNILGKAGFVSRIVESMDPNRIPGKFELKQEIDLGHPVTFWLSGSDRPSQYISTQEGKTYFRQFGEHAVCVCGYRQRASGQLEFLVKDPYPVNQGKVYWTSYFSKWQEVFQEMMLSIEGFQGK